MRTLCSLIFWLWDVKHSQPCFATLSTTKRISSDGTFLKMRSAQWKTSLECSLCDNFWQDMLIPANLQRWDFLTLSGISVRQKCPQRQSGGIKPARGGQLHIQLNSRLDGGINLALPFCALKNGTSFSGAMAFCFSSQRTRSRSSYTSRLKA